MSNRSSESIEERLALLQQVHFGRGRELKSADPLEPTPMLVPIERIKEYDRNPRRERNAAYEIIKQSLRQRGFRGSLPITRRPDDDAYMVAEGGNTVLHIVKELYEETQDPQFSTLQCLFEPWISESETLIAHLVENDSRGELPFIDRARAAQELRVLLEHETGTALSTRDLATRLRTRGYPIDHASLAKMDYAIETLFPCIPMAFRAGLGLSQVERIRALERIFVAFLEDRKRAPDAVEDARKWFLGCLVRYDSEALMLTLEPVQRAIEAHAAELCGESVAKVRADFGFIEATGQPGHDAPPPEPFKLRERGVSVAGIRTGRSTPAVESDTSTEVHGEPSPKKPLGDDAFEIEAEQVNEEAERRPLTRSGAPVLELHKNADLPQDVKSLRGRMWTLAMQLGQHHGLSPCIHPCPAGCGFIMDLPEHRLYAGEEPESAGEAQRVTLWWMLAALSEEWPYGIGQAPSLPFLEAARIYPAIVAVAEDDRSTLTDILMPWVSFPPSLDIAVRQLFATLGDRDYGRLLQLVDTRRALQAHCRRLGKRIVWEL